MLSHYQTVYIHRRVLSWFLQNTGLASKPSLSGQDRLNFGQNHMCLVPTLRVSFPKQAKPSRALPMHQPPKQRYKASVASQSTHCRCSFHVHDCLQQHVERVNCQKQSTHRTVRPLHVTQTEACMQSRSRTNQQQQVHHFRPILGFGSSLSSQPLRATLA